MDETSYELPDGQMIRLDEHCRFNTLEILFAPEKYAQAMGLHLSGGVNLCYGVPASAAAAGGGASGAAGGGPPGSAGGLGSATEVVRLRAASRVGGLAGPAQHAGVSARVAAAGQRAGRPRCRKHLVLSSVIAVVVH